MKVGWRHFLRPAGVVLLSVAIGLAMCEGTLRLVFALGLLADDNSWVALVRSVHHRDPSLAASGQQLFRRSPNRVLGWEPVPGFESGHVRINAAGFRGPEIERHPPAGTVRIAVLGDSETFAMIPRSKTAPCSWVTEGSAEATSTCSTSPCVRATRGWSACGPSPAARRSTIICCTRPSSSTGRGGLWRAWRAS